MSSDESDTRTRILQAALALLEAGRGAPVRMSDIARRAGISRQALYLHFEARAALLLAVTHYLDEIKDSAARLAPSRTAATGVERLDAWIEAWAGYIPEIYGVAKALLAMGDSDAAAAEAWTRRMQDMREGCEAAIKALARDGALAPDHGPKQATDLLWTLLSVRNWERLTQDCGWSQKRYAETMRLTARRLFVAEPASKRRGRN